MATMEMGGESGGGAPNGWTWSVSYDDVARQITLRADGVGWGAVVLRDNTNSPVSAVFLQPGQDPAVAVQPGERTPASFNPTITVTANAGPTVVGVRARQVVNPRDGLPRFVLDQAPWFPPPGWLSS